MRIAHNPKTGEYLGLQGGEWKPLRIAENKAGDRLFLGENGWEPLKFGSAETPDTKQSSLGDVVSRGFSFGTRNLLEGLGDIPQMLLNEPINAVFGTKLRNPGEVIADAIGLQKAKTDGDEVLGAALRGGAAALPTLAAGAAPAVAKAAPKLASFLSAAPMEQMASGAAAGAASESVKQGGGGTGAQIAAGMAAGLLPGTLSFGGRSAVRTAKAGSRALEALSEGGQNRIAAENLRSMASHPEELVKKLENAEAEIVPGSVPTLAEVAEDAGIAVAQKGRRNRNAAFAEREVEQNAARQADVASSADRLSPLSAYDFPESDGGQVLRDVYGERYAAQRDATKQAYEAIDQDGTTSFNLAPLRQAFAETMDQGRFAPQMPADIRRFMGQLDEAIANGETASYRDLQNIRTTLTDLAFQAQQNGDANMTRISQGMKRKLDEYLETAAEYADQPVTPQPGSAAYRAARQEASAIAKAKVAADSPMWDQVWKHLDADSLARDFPDAKRELAQLHGRGLFARKGEGLPVDELADSLKIQGWLAPDADSSTLVELLKSKARGKASAASELDNVLDSATQFGTGFTPEQAQAFNHAKAMRREQGALFEQNFNEKMSRGLLRDDQVLGNYFKPGPAGDGAAKDFLRAFGNDQTAYGVLRDHIVRKFRKAAIDEKGKVNLSRMQKWMTSHADALSNFPELRKQLMDIVNRMAADIGRTRLMDSLSAVRGSPTAQNLATQAIMDTMLGKSLGRGNQGLASAGIKGMLAGGVNRLTQALYGPADARINQLLDDAFLDPNFALKLLKNYKPFTPKVDLKSVFKETAKAQGNVQIRSLLDRLMEDDEKK